MRTLTPGRWHGLKTTSTPENKFAILAFDQRGSYQKMLPAGASFEDAMTIKRDIVVPLSAYASAVLLDAEYGLPAMLDMNPRSGLLMALEESGYTGDSTFRQVAFYETWSVSKIKAVGASAVKLLVYYHPDSGALAEEIEQVVQNVLSDCHSADLPLFVEPVSYSLDAKVNKSSAEYAATRPRVVQETARRMSKLGPDVLKLEFPVDADFDQDVSGWQAQCEALSAVSHVPWVLLSAGVDFDVFEKQVEASCRAGASGFLAGRAIWKEAVSLGADERSRYVAHTCSDRLLKLKDIAEKYARPWTDFYQPLPAAPNWFTTYA